MLIGVLLLVGLATIIIDRRQVPVDGNSRQQKLKKRKHTYKIACVHENLLTRQNVSGIIWALSYCSSVYKWNCIHLKTITV